MSWRKATLDDLTSIFRTSGIVHPCSSEDLHVFRDKLSKFPDGCFVLDNNFGGTLAYLLSHPWQSTRAPLFNQTLGDLPEEPDTYFIHDLAIRHEARGLGFAKPALDFAVAAARHTRCPTISLIAAHGSAPFWQKQRFHVAAPPAPVRDEILSYGADAKFMIREVV